MIRSWASVPEPVLSAHFSPKKQQLTIALFVESARGRMSVDLFPWHSFTTVPDVGSIPVSLAFQPAGYAPV